MFEDTPAGEILNAILTLEDDDLDPTYDEVIDAYQVLIDTGVVWKLQGHYGRSANALINQGACTR